MQHHKQTLVGKFTGKLEFGYSTAREKCSALAGHHQLKRWKTLQKEKPAATPRLFLLQSCLHSSFFMKMAACTSENKYFTTPEGRQWSNKHPQQNGDAWLTQPVTNPSYGIALEMTKGLLAMVCVYFKWMVHKLELILKLGTLKIVS